MTEERLKKIEQYLMGLPPVGWEDAKELIAEVRRLRSEERRLRATLESSHENWHADVKTALVLKEENAALKDLAAKACQESHDYAVLLREAREILQFVGDGVGVTARIDAALGNEKAGEE